MDTDPAAANHINRLENTSSNEQATKLPLLFESMLDPDQEPRLTYSYVISIQRVFSREMQGMEDTESPGRGFSRFGQAALDAGLVPTIKSVISTINQGNYSVLTIYYGIETLTLLFLTGTLEQRHTLSKKILEHDILTIVYKRLESYPYFIVRIIAAEFLATVAKNSDYFTAQPDIAVPAEMIFQCCQACLVGPDSAEKEMHDPSRGWTTRHVWGVQRRMTTLEAVIVAPRRYGILQERMFYSVVDLVAPFPVRKKTAVLEMMRKRPQILSQMLAIAAETRPPGYPETEVYSIAAQCFASLINLPVGRVPGVPVSVEGGLQREIDEEWAATLEILRMVTSTPRWVSKIYAVWNRIEAESWMNFQPLLSRITDLYDQNDPLALSHILRHRGASRISILRAVISLTYACDPLPDSFILAFLRVAYACSQKVPRAEDIRPGDQLLNTLHMSVERSQEVARKPHLATASTPGYSLILYREEFVGPIAFLRLLLLLSERGFLSKIPSWPSIPSYNGDAVGSGAKKPSLSQLKQITSPAVIREFVSTTLKRVVELREVRGRGEVREGKFGDARWSYACGSELSAAIVAFLESREAATELKSKFLDDAKKELVLCLGNAAEVSIRGKNHLEGLKFASAAVAIGATCAGITETIITKNKNRYETALNAMH